MNIENRENYGQEGLNFQNNDKKEAVDHSFTDNAEPDYGEDLVNDESDNKEFDGNNLSNKEFDQENLENEEIDNDQFATEDFNNQELDNEKLSNEDLDNEDLGNKSDKNEPFITG